MVIKRESYLKKIRPFINKDLVKVFTGIRRSGKSTLLKLIQEEIAEQGASESQIYSINFESMEYSNKPIEDVYQEIINFSKNHTGKNYIFLDEIQELKQWEKMVNSLRVDIDCDLYITGSNAKLLSGEMATYLAGRYIEIAVYPFSFQEIIKIGEEKNSQKSKEEIFNHYLIYGGMPFIYESNLDETAALDYLRDIYNSILLKDIVKRYSIRDIDLLDRIISYFTANIANTFSGTSMNKYLKSEKRSISLETLYNYVSYTQEACLFYLVSREDIQGKKMLKFQEKIFLADHGIREAIYGNNTRDINQVLENIVFLELKRRGYKIHVGKKGEREIDFIAHKKADKIYVQVTYLIADENVANREFTPLQSIRDNYPKIVLSLDKFDFSREGVIHQNIMDFLLKPEDGH